MKRFYKVVSPQSASKDGYDHILLDGKTVKTPLKYDFICPTSLSNLVIQEWSAQGEAVIPETMPITQLLFTAYDRTQDQRSTITQELLSYLSSDLLFFHTDTPPELANKQNELWFKWIQYGQDYFGNLPAPTTSLTLPALDQTTHDRAQEYLDNMPLLTLTCMAQITNMAGSFLLAFAFIEGAINTQDLINAALCEEFFYIDLYDTEKNGLDPALEAKINIMKQDLIACAHIIKSTKS